MSEIHTKFGTAKINKRGYYIITSRKEGNNHKYLHRLVWEDHYNREVPNGYDIHHINEDKKDCRIQNLQCVEHTKHSLFHKKSISKEVRNKISKSLSGLKKSKEHCLNNSRSRNTSGYYRVSIKKSSDVKQGFLYVYKYYDEGGKEHTISSIDILKLKRKVLSKGLEWVKL